MIIYGEKYGEELNLMKEYRTYKESEVKRERIAKVNIPNIAYLNQHIGIIIPHDSRNHVIVSDTVKIKFNLDIESTEKTPSKEIGTNALMKKN